MVFSSPPLPSLLCVLPTFFLTLYFHFSSMSRPLSLFPPLRLSSLFLPPLHAPCLRNFYHSYYMGSSLFSHSLSPLPIVISFFFTDSFLPLIVCFIFFGAFPNFLPVVFFFLFFQIHHSFFLSLQREILFPLVHLAPLRRVS